MHNWLILALNVDSIFPTNVNLVVGFMDTIFEQNKGSQNKFRMWTPFSNKQPVRPSPPYNASNAIKPTIVSPCLMGMYCIQQFHFTEIGKNGSGCIGMSRSHPSLCFNHLIVSGISLLQSSLCFSYLIVSPIDRIASPTVYHSALHIVLADGRSSAYTLQCIAVSLVS